MSGHMHAYAVEPGAGGGVRNPVGGRLVFKPRGEQSDGAMTVIETEAAPDEGRRFTSTTSRTRRS